MRTVFLPDPELAPYVRMSMIGRFDTEIVHMPASADAQLLIYLRGGALIAEGVDRWQPLPPMFVSGARLAPSVYRVLPDSAFVGVVFRPGGLHACFGVPACELRERILPLDTLLAPAAVERIVNELGEANAPNELPGLVKQLLLARPRSASPGAGRTRLARLSLDDLLLPAGELSHRLGIGPRQMERRFLDSHGLALRDLRRLARFSNGLMRMMRPGAGALTAIALEARYSDQAHFSREFRAFVGQTPGQFLLARRAPDAAVRLWQFDEEELAAFADLA